MGFGTAGRVYHAPFIDATPEIELAAIVTGDPERASMAAALFPRARVVASATDLWDSGSYDLAVIATPNESHAVLAHGAISRRVTTVIDKPLATSSREARAIVEHAESAKVPITVYQNRRWDSDFLTARAVLASESLGKVRTFESRFSWRSDRLSTDWRNTTPTARGGGILFDMAPHLIDQAVLLFGPVSSWYAEFDTTDSHLAAADEALVLLTHDSGVRSRLSMSSSAPRRADRLRIVGTEAAFVYRECDPQDSQILAGMDPRDPTFGYNPGAGASIGTDTHLEPVSAAHGNYTDFYRRVARAVNGNEDVPVNPMDSILVLELIEAILRDSTTPGSSRGWKEN